MKPTCLAPVHGEATAVRFPPETPRSKSKTMRSRRNRFCRLSLAVASLVMLGAEPSLAQSVAVPCSAFTRNGDGEWKVLAPVMLHIDGRLLGPIVVVVRVLPSTPSSASRQRLLVMGLTSTDRAFT